MSKPPPNELDEVMSLLPEPTLHDLKWWGMGWIAEIAIGHWRFRLVSDRGNIDVYDLSDGHERHIMPPEDQRLEITPRQVALLISNRLESPHG